MVRHPFWVSIVKQRLKTYLVHVPGVYSSEERKDERQQPGQTSFKATEEKKEEQGYNLGRPGVALDGLATY